jgi:hypothetical protein
MYATAELFGPFHSPRGPLRPTRQRLASASPHQLERLFGSWLPPGLLAQAEAGPHSRQRVYTLQVTFWTFLWQVLHPGSACSDAVSQISAWFRSLGRPRLRGDSSPYCQARRRLPVETLQRALHASAQAAEQRAGGQWLFHGREVRVADGTFSSAPDTRNNQRAYPQSARQAEGCGFPLVRWVALFSLTSGALLEVVLGNKHQSELSLFRRLWEELKAGMIFLADRAFCDYVTIAALWHRQVDAVLRLHGTRGHDLRHGQRLGRYDRLVTWLKPIRKPRTATWKLWRTLPDHLPLRLIAYPVHVPGFRARRIFLVTTLLDPVADPAADLARLYLRRWRVELYLRHIKTTLGLDMLTCKSPAMLHRELLLHCIGYNLVRGLIAQASSLANLDVERISFKDSLAHIRNFSQVIAAARSLAQRDRLFDDLLWSLAHALVPERPHRVEPRCLKRRRKAYPVMVKPRAELKARLLRSQKPQK